MKEISLYTISEKMRRYLDMIKFEHSIFALPFAYLGLFLGAGGRPPLAVFWWVSLAMVSFRTAAMSINRLVDRSIDAINPRTSSWALPQKVFSISTVFIVSLLSLTIYFLAVSRLNRICLWFSPIPVVFVVTYPYLKRFTWLSHFVLGMILGMAPAGGWMAGRGTLEVPAWLLFVAVACWVAGFDMIYALQDMSFDRLYGLKSFPACFDMAATLLATRILHGATLIFLAALGMSLRLADFYWLGLMGVGLFLMREHWLIKKWGVQKIQQAFFQMNASVSVVIFLATWLDLLL